MHTPISPLAATLPPTSHLSRLVASLQHYPLQELLWSLGTLAVAILVGRVAAGLFVAALRRWSRKTDTIVDDAFARHVHGPLKWLGPIVLVDLVLPLTDLPHGWLSALKHIVLISMISTAGWVLLKCTRVVEEVVNHRYNIDTRDNLHARAVYTQMRAFRNIASFSIVIVTLAFVLTTFDKVRQVGAGLLASAGLAGIVLGFAAQKSLGTILAGIQIALTQPIRVEDVVIVEGEWGTIEEITLTYVVVQIWDFRRLIVPISYFIEKPFQNWTRVSAKLLGTVDLYFDYAVPVEALRAELKRILDASEFWDKESWGLQVTDATEQSMLVRPLMSAADSGKAWNLRCEVREKLIAFVQEQYPQCLPRHRAELNAKSNAIRNPS
jgi:small-conductance mechanosensitive channel